MDLTPDPTQPTYVQVARGLLADASSLTLLDLAPATLFTGGQPAGSVGMLSTGQFLDRWYAADAGIGSTLVPAVLSLLDAGRPAPDDVHVLIGLPRIRGAGVEYRLHEPVDGLPRAAGACVLFIRPLVRPITPGSARATPTPDRSPMNAA